MPEQPLIRRDSHTGTFDLSALRLAAQLPDALADLGDRLCGDRLSEARQSARRVHGHPPTELGVAVTQELLGLARLAEADVLVPVEL